MQNFGILGDLFADPRATLIVLLLALPGRLLAISAHEAAHAWMANRCGDPTARMLGRVTLNPLKHLDPVGLVCMLVLGIGWAKPVPVNPRNYRDYRRDDLKVSIAGIAMNLLLFAAGCIVMYAVIAAALASVPVRASLSATDALFRTTADGVPVLVNGQYYYYISDLLRYGIGLSDVLIAPAFGAVAGYAYQMLGYFVMTNLVLAIFNLIPLPPLDGYHVLNDLILKGRLFASRQAQGISMAILYLAMFSGALSEVLSRAYAGVLTGVGALMSAVFRAFGLF